LLPFQCNRAYFVSRLKAIAAQGQSIWLDYIRRDMVDDGSLERLIAEDGISGLTSNPAIFEKAIAASTLYDASLAGHVHEGQQDPEQLVEALAIEDIRMAADAFWPVYQATQGKDGYVSLEVSPRLASDTARTLAEAELLWHTVGRPNLMIKVPGTPEGVPVVRALTAAGVNVNITLLFSRSAYLAVAEAYLQGLEDRVSKGEPVDHVASVASFFISRIDAAVDPLLVQAGDVSAAGRVAVANARLADLDFQQLMASARWQALAQRGAQPQRLLWASTGTKNPSYRDTMYLEQLMGAETVNTVPPATLDAFRDHGACAPTLCTQVAESQALMAALPDKGIDLDAITQQLVVDGVQLFVDAWDKLLQAVAAKRDAIRHE